jgi:hypothetical protein
VIRLAVKRLSKPGLALVLGQAMTSPGAPGVPEELERLLREAVLVARCGLAMSPD